MLAGSGGTVAAHFTPSLIGVIGAAAGIVCGILAMIGPAVRLLREGPLASMASVGGVQRAATGDVLGVHQGATRRQPPSAEFVCHNDRHARLPGL
jgi:hypothetical protein